MGKLLIIDDEEDLRDVLCALLEDVTTEIVTCQNGLEACEVLENHSFDAILSDEKMPKRTGMEVLRWLRSRGDKTPFIIHTGYGHKAMQEEAQALDVFYFVDKPWDEKVLIKIVSDALQVKK